MNNGFQVSSPVSRGVFAVAACLATVVIGASICGLAIHYSGNAPVPSGEPVLTAQR